MPKEYTIFARQTVYYEIKTIADNENEAIENIHSGLATWEEIDADHFQIEEIEED